MESDFLETYDNFIFSITGIPGSSDEVCQQAIKHYKDLLEGDKLPPTFNELTKAIIHSLEEYYKLSSLKGENLRNVLPHLSEIARFMEDKTSTNVDVESTGRIKSFHSAYTKIISGLLLDYLQKSIPIEENSFTIDDTLATRDILHPRHDMKSNTTSFYRLTYSLILNFMEHIDELSKEDPRYGLKEYPQRTLLDLKMPKKYDFPPEWSVVIPDKDFLDYAFELRNVPEGYKYLPDSLTNGELEGLKHQIELFKESDKIDSSSPLYKCISDKARFDTFIQHRNTIQEEVFESLEKSNLLKRYKEIPVDEFWDENFTKLQPRQRDMLEYLDFLNEIIDNNKESDAISVIGDYPDFEDVGFIKDLKEILTDLSSRRDEIIAERLEAIQDIDLSTFNECYEQAKKLKKFEKCAKDYMRFPKESGYQSFHMIINTPYGCYEKQIRTEAQDDFAEKGPASHTNSYKPFSRSIFHRLKVPTVLSPKRDASGDIIYPIELGVLPFELAVHQYYKQPFTNFSGGKTLAQFKEEHPDKEDFDKALLDLTIIKEKDREREKERKNIFATVFSKIFPSKSKDEAKQEDEDIVKISTPQAPAAFTSSHYDDGPEDISAYPGIVNLTKDKNANQNKPNTDPEKDPNKKDENNVDPRNLD